MEHDRSPQNPQGPDSPAPVPAEGRTRRLLRNGALGLLLVAGATLVVGSVQAWGGRGRGHGTDFVQWRVSRMLDRVDATEEQRERIGVLIETAFADLGSLRGGHGEAHEQVVAALLAEPVDEQALEALRAEHLARFDEASQRLLATLVEVGDALTPEQRTEIVEQMGDHGHGFGRRRWH